MESSQLPATFTYRQARKLGLSKRALYELRDAGEIETLSRGLYRRRGAELVDEDLLEIARRAPRATLCLGTALSRHQLSDDIASAPDIAILRGTRAPQTRARARWHRFDPASFDLGRELLPLEAETAIGLYSAERSIVDAYRLRGREGHDMANEALRRWLRRPGAQPSSLLELATHFPRALTPLRRALEILL
jgi:Transcriptional regulator, AbiEi antitoxin